MTSATVETVAIRRPAMNAGSASGRSTCTNSRADAVAHAAGGLADVGGHPCSPARKFRTRMTSEYATRPISTVVADSAR